MNSVIYLEYDNFDSELKYPEDLEDKEYYSIGELFITSSSDILSEHYKVRAYFGERIIYDELQYETKLHDDVFLYSLKHTESHIDFFVPMIKFLVIKDNVHQFKNQNLWKIIELDPLLLDLLEDAFEYNLVGTTRDYIYE